MNRVRKTAIAAKNSLERHQISALSRIAGRLATQYLKKGGHWSESVFSAVAEVLGLKVKPSPFKMASAFHGGGGATKVGESWTPTGCICGALAGGVLAIGILYGRTDPKQSTFGCASELSAELHKRFQEELGAKCCAILRPFYKKTDSDNTCKFIYQRGAELAIETVLSAPRISEQCKMPLSLKKIMKWDL